MNKVLSKNLIGMLFVKLLSMVVSLVTLPLCLSYFDGNKEHLGQWLAIFSAVTILMSLDFGVASRLKNDLLSSSSDWSNYISKVFFINIIISSFISFALIITWLLDVVYIFSSLSLSQVFLLSSFLILMSIFRCCIPILQARQKNWFSAFVVLLPQIFILVFLVFFSNHIDLNKLDFLFYVFVASAFFCYSICLFSLLNGLDYTLNFRWYGVEELFSYIKRSFGFFLTQVGLILLLSSNDIIYGMLNKPEMIADYQYYFRIYALIFVGFSSVTVPFWSAIRHQHINGKYRSVNKMINFLFLLLVPVLILVIAVGFYIQNIFDFWLGNNVHSASNELTISFSLLSLSMCIMYACSAVLNAYDNIVFQAKSLLLAAIIKFLFIFFSGFYVFGVDKVVFSTVISMSFVALSILIKVFLVHKYYRA